MVLSTFEGDLKLETLLLDVVVMVAVAGAFSKKSISLCFSSWDFLHGG